MSTTEYQQQPPAQPRNGLGVAALVVGIVGVALAAIPFIGFVGFILGVLGVIFGAVAVNRVRKGAATNKGVSITGLVTGAVAVVVSTVVFVATMVAIGDSADQLDRDLAEIEEQIDRDFAQIEEDLAEDEALFNDYMDCVEAVDVAADDFDQQMADCDAMLEATS